MESRVKKTKYLQLKNSFLLILVFVATQLPEYVYSCASNETEQCISGILFKACACVYDPTKGSSLPIILPIAIIPLHKKVQKSVSDIQANYEKAISDIAKNIGKSSNDINHNLSKAEDDIKKNYNKAEDDVKKEADVFISELKNLGKALVGYTDSYMHGTSMSYKDAVQRFREGKVVDSIWHLTLSPIRVAEDSAGDAVIESSYLMAIGQATAATYGPGGAAAYAAWIAYRQTHDLELAIKTGILAGASNVAFTESGKISDLAKRAIVTSAIAGSLVSVAGGDSEDVTKAMLQSAAMTVIQDSYRKITNDDLDGKPSNGKPSYCLNKYQTKDCTPVPNEARLGKLKPDGTRDYDPTYTDSEGNYVIDKTHPSIDKKIPAVGTQQFDPKNPNDLANEHSSVMRGISKIPGMQNMAIFHDQWALQANMGSFTTKASILPAMILTYIGRGTPYYENLVQTSIDNSLEDYYSDDSHGGILKKAADSTDGSSGELKTSKMQNNLLISNETVKAYLKINLNSQLEKALIHEKSLSKDLSAKVTSRCWLKNQSNMSSENLIDKIKIKKESLTNPGNYGGFSFQQNSFGKQSYIKTYANFELNQKTNEEKINNFSEYMNSLIYKSPTYAAFLKLDNSLIGEQSKKLEELRLQSLDFCQQFYNTYRVEAIEYKEICRQYSETLVENEKLLKLGISPISNEKNKDIICRVQLPADFACRVYSIEKNGQKYKKSSLIDKTKCNGVIDLVAVEEIQNMDEWIVTEPRAR